jgi:hypothetical protein
MLAVKSAAAGADAAAMMRVSAASLTDLALSGLRGMTSPH